MFARRRRGRCYRRLGQRRSRASRNKTPENNGDPDLPYGPAVQGPRPRQPAILCGAFASALDGVKLRCTMAIGEGQSGHAWSEASVNTNLPQSSGVTPYTARYGFTSENRTIPNVSCFNIGTATTLFTRAVPTALHSKSAIWLNGRDNKRPGCPISAAVQSSHGDSGAFREVIVRYYQVDNHKSFPHYSFA